GLWRDAGANFGRKIFIQSIAPDFARTGRPAPDVDLALAAAAQENAAVARIGHLDLLLLALIVKCVFAAGQDDGAHLLFGFWVPAPITDENEVAVFLLRPEIFVLGFAFAVVVENPIFRLPMTFVAGLVLPSSQVDAGVKRLESFGERRDFVRLRIGGRQFLD